MEMDIFKKIRLISKSGFLASSLLNIGAMDSENKITEKELKKIIEIKKTIVSEVDKSLKIIREAREKNNTNFLKNFKDIINIRNCKYRKDPFYDRKRIGSMIPLNPKELMKQNKELYENLNKIFGGNLITDFKFNNNIDQYIKLNSIYNYVKYLPSIEKLWNICGGKGYSAKLYNFYSSIKSINGKNINSFYDKYKTEKNSYELNKEGNNLGTTEKNKNYLSLKFIDCFLNNVINRDKEKSLSEINLIKSFDEKILKIIFNKKTRKKLFKRNLLKSFDETILNEIFSNKTTIFHELNHFNNYIIEILSKNKEDQTTASFTAIESDIHKIINYYCKWYYETNKKKFLSSEISQILAFILNEKNDKKIKEILEEYDDIYNYEGKDEKKLKIKKYYKKIYNEDGYVKYSEKLNEIRDFLSLGSKEQQCKLLEILSYVGNVLMIHNKKNIEDNITKYGTSAIDEMSAECGSFALLAKDKYSKHSEILFAGVQHLVFFINQYIFF